MIRRIELGPPPIPNPEDGKEEFYAALEADPRFASMVEEQALRLLNDSRADILEKDGLSGEVSSEGYLLKKDGTESNLLPSMVIGIDLEDVKDVVRQKLAHLRSEE